MIKSILNQYISECNKALIHAAKITKSFEKVFKDTMKLLMAIPNRINFLQLGRYGSFSEQTYKNNFEKTFDWLSFNIHLAKKYFTGDRKAIAIDPSYLPKAGHKTPWIGYFWSGQAGSIKRGLEIMGIGLVDANDNDCIVLNAQQTPDTTTLEVRYKNLVEWYVAVIKSIKDKLQEITTNLVADAYFSKETFVNPMIKEGFNVISRFRNDAVLFYPTTKERTGKRGRPSVYDGKIDFKNLDLSKCEQHNVDKGSLYSLKAYSKALKKTIKLVIWYTDETKSRHQIYFSTNEDEKGNNVLDIYKTRFQLEFCFRDSKQHTGLTHCQSTSINKLAFSFNASLTSVNIAKVACKVLKTKFSITSCKAIIHNMFMLERFICVCGIEPDTQLIDKLFKELIVFAATAA